MFIGEHYFAYKSFYAVLEAFSDVYCDMEIPNKAKYDW